MKKPPWVVRFFIFSGLSLAVAGLLVSANLLLRLDAKPTSRNNQPEAKITLLNTSQLPKREQKATTPLAPLTAATITSPTSVGKTTQEDVRISDRKDDQMITELIAQMSLVEKVGQLFLVFFEGPVLSDELREMIAEYHVGGVVLFANVGNVQDVRQVAKLINDAQRVATSTERGIPLFVAIDQEGGQIVRLTEEATHFPSNMAVGATGSLTAAAQMAAVSAKELRALGINMNLAPVLDVNDNPDNPVIGLRSFGASPTRVAQLGKVMIQAYKAEGVIATVKHFPGHGNTETDSHYGLPIVNRSLEDIRQIELYPFQQAIDNGVDAIMTAHVLFPAIEGQTGYPATLSSKVLTRLLRDEMHYDGLVLSDSMTMGAIDETYGSAQASVMAFEAGADVLAFGADIGHSPREQKAAYRAVLNAIRAKPELQKRLDESVRRILALKLHYGLLRWQPINLDDISDQVGIESHRQVAREIAAQSITLLQDKQNLLPITSTATTPATTLLVLPRDAAEFGNHLSQCLGLLKTIVVASNPDESAIERAVAASGDYDRIIVGTTNARRRPGQVRLVKALARLRNDAIIVTALMEPYDLMAFPEVSTYLVSYGISTVSLEAMAVAVCGKAKVQGSLPVDLPGLYPLGAGIRSE